MTSTGWIGFPNTRKIIAPLICHFALSHFPGSQVLLRISSLLLGAQLTQPVSHYSKSKTLRKNENSNTLKLNYAKTINALVLILEILELILEQRRERIMNSMESAIYIARRMASAYLSPATSSTAPGIPKISVIQKP